MKRKSAWATGIIGLLMAVWLPSMRPPAEMVERRELLSEYGFFEGPPAKLKPAQGVITYTLNAPLFTNYAGKTRFIKLPPGGKALYNDTGAFDMPEGTVIIKNFWYPKDFRRPEENVRLVETRLLVKQSAGWQAWPYVWKEDQSDAVYEPAGDKQTIKFINTQGKQVTTPYLVPNKNQCKGCHAQYGQMVPIGIAARHLHKDMEMGGTVKSQLQHWKELGLLDKVPSTVHALVDYADVQATLNDRARAYLDIHCGHCHSKGGPANTSGLRLDVHEKDAVALGIGKPPVAAGRGSGNRAYDIVPGKPDASILLYRMQSLDPGVAMPELGRDLVHEEGVALIREWIKNMKQ